MPAGGPGSTVRAGHVPKAPGRAPRSALTIRSPTSCGRIPLPAVGGPVKCRPTEAEWEYAARGAMNIDRTASTGAASSRVSSRRTTRRLTATSARCRSTRSSRTDTGSPPSPTTAESGDWFIADHDTDLLVTPQRQADGDERVCAANPTVNHRSYCNWYRVAARSKNLPDSSTANYEFRCVVDAGP